MQNLHGWRSLCGLYSLWTSSQLFYMCSCPQSVSHLSSKDQRNNTHLHVVMLLVFTPSLDICYCTHWHDLIFVTIHAERFWIFYSIHQHILNFIIRTNMSWILLSYTFTYLGFCCLHINIFRILLLYTLTCHGFNYVASISPYLLLFPLAIWIIIINTDMFSILLSYTPTCHKFC